MAETLSVSVGVLRRRKGLPLSAGRNAHITTKISDAFEDPSACDARADFITIGPPVCETSVTTRA